MTKSKAPKEGKTEIFTYNGNRYSFFNEDHLPVHFHVIKAGTTKVFFAGEIVYEVGIFKRILIKQLAKEMDMIKAWSLSKIISENIDIVMNEFINRKLYNKLPVVYMVNKQNKLIKNK
jgi:hypothetical protein